MVIYKLTLSSTRGRAFDAELVTLVELCGMAVKYYKRNYGVKL
jgi:hypothetical protein